MLFYFIFTLLCLDRVNLDYLLHCLIRIFRLFFLCFAMKTDEESSEKDWMLVEQKGGLRQTTVSSLGTEPDSSELEVQVRLAGGIGVSVINAVPEELVFASLEQIEVSRYSTNIAPRQILHLYFPCRNRYLAVTPLVLQPNLHEG